MERAEEVNKEGSGKEVISSSIQGIRFLKTAFSQTKVLSSGNSTLQGLRALCCPLEYKLCGHLSELCGESSGIRQDVS